MGLHRLTCRIVKDQISKIELHDTVQPARKLGKERFELAVRRDRLRDPQQSLIAAVQKFRLLPFHVMFPHATQSIFRSKSNQVEKRQ